MKRPTPPEPLPQFDWTDAKWGDCGCGTRSHVVPFEEQMCCANCIDGIEMDRHKEYAEQLGKYADHLEKQTHEIHLQRAGYLHMSGHMINEGLARIMGVPINPDHWRPLYLKD